MSGPQPVVIPDNRTALLDASGKLSRPWITALQNLVAFVVGFLPRFLSNTHAVRLTVSAANYPDGTLFYETDRTTYYIARGDTWLWYGGMMSGFQADLAAITDLGANDVGFLFWVTDYNHVLLWTWDTVTASGTWRFAPGDTNDYSLAFVTSPDPTDGWQACDGSTVQKLNSDGSLSDVTVPNSAGSFYRL